MGALDRPSARRCTEHSRPVDDATGSLVLDDTGDERRRGAHAKHHWRCWNRDCRRHAYAAALDHLASEVPAVAAGILHQRSAHVSTTAAFVVPCLSVERICVCGFGRRFRNFQRVCSAQRGEAVCPAWHYRCCGDCRIDRLRRVAGAPVRGLRLLALESEFPAATLWCAADHSDCDLCMVPVGFRAKGVQPGNSTGTNLAPRLLGAPRIRLRKILDPAEAGVFDCESDLRPRDCLYGDASAFDLEDELQEEN